MLCCAALSSEALRLGCFAQLGFAPIDWALLGFVCFASLDRAAHRYALLCRDCCVALCYSPLGLAPSAPLGLLGCGALRQIALRHAELGYGCCAQLGFAGLCFTPLGYASAARLSSAL